MLFLYLKQSAVKAASIAFVKSVVDHPIKAKTLIHDMANDEELPNKSSVRSIARPATAHTRPRDAMDPSFVN